MAYGRADENSTGSVEAHLHTGNMRFLYAEAFVAQCAPATVEANFEASFIVKRVMSHDLGAISAAVAACDTQITVWHVVNARMKPLFFLTFSSTVESTR